MGENISWDLGDTSVQVSRGSISVDSQAYLTIYFERSGHLSGLKKNSVISNINLSIQVDIDHNINLEIL